MRAKSEEKRLIEVVHSHSNLLKRNKELPQEKEEKRSLAKELTNRIRSYRTPLMF